MKEKEVIIVLASVAANAEMTNGTISPTLMARAGTGGGQLPILILINKDDKDGDGKLRQQMIYTTAKQDYHTKVLSDTAFALTASDYKDPPTLTRVDVGDNGLVERTEVRRITELECERLQGYPDNWTLIGRQDNNGDYWYTDSIGNRKKVTSSARYKALGNSIAIPFWRYLARRIMAQYEHKVTIGSLFDGIGGFPLVFQQCGAIPVWASEIEEFPIAVTKERFPETEDPEESRIQSDTLLMEEAQEGRR